MADHMTAHCNFCAEVHLQPTVHNPSNAMAEQAQGSAAGNVFSMSEVSSTKYTTCVSADAMLQMAPPGVSAALTKACRNTCSALKATCTALAGTVSLGVSQAFRALLQAYMKFVRGASSACKKGFAAALKLSIVGLQLCFSCKVYRSSSDWC
jgi:hypothetical protein